MAVVCRPGHFFLMPCPSLRSAAPCSFLCVLVILAAIVVVVVVNIYLLWFSGHGDQTNSVGLNERKAVWGGRKALAGSGGELPGGQ